MSNLTPPRQHAIKRHTRETQPLSFAGLRAQGIALAQAASGKLWTDYNVHDPGVTILEQLCYALTDLIQRADCAVADHLTGPDGRIDFERLSLHLPQTILPCRPTTASDYRRVLLDQVTGIEDASLQTQPPGNGAKDAGVAGLYHLMLDPTDSSTQAVQRCARQARDAYLRRRNLCEDLDHRATLVRLVPCELHAEIEIGGARDPVDVLAEIYSRCDRYLTARAERRSIETLLKHGRSLEEIFTGPAVEHGWSDAAELAASDTTTLFVGDLAAQISQVDGVREVRRLAVQAGNKPPVSGSLPWRGTGWALRLQLPEADGAAGHVRLHRRESVLELAPHEVHSKYQDRRATLRARQLARQDLDTAVPAPAGEHRQLDRYYSIQHDFPAIYGLGQHGVPPGASARERAQVQQLKGYLVLFEQLLANGMAQLQQVRELFSGHGELEQSYWWRMLDDAVLPGVRRLYRMPPAQIQAQVYAPYDNYGERRGRVLDHLLALHGVSYPQNSLRQFWSYLGAAELDAILLYNKAAFLEDIVALSRDRAGGFDYGELSWEQADNCPGLQRRVGLLLGFQRPWSHSLTDALRQHSRELVPPEREIDAADAGRCMVEPGQALLPVPRAPRVEPEVAAASIARMPPLRGRQLNEALLRAGVYAERYRLLESNGVHRLLLQPDERDGWWDLGEYPSPTEAALACAGLRELLLQLNHASEGLHLVEHILLRPMGEDPPHLRLQLPEHFYSLRFTAVFPAWTARCHQQNFRRFAAETLHMNSPAHLSASCVWLDFAAMLEFESRYVRWLQAKLVFTRTPSAARRVELDVTAAAVIECLLRHRGEG